jgi:hypothetical protein
LEPAFGCRKLLIARQIELLVGKQGFILRLLRHRLIVLCLIDHRIDLAEHVALLDVLALDEIHRDQLAVDLRAHEHIVQRADRADCVEIDRTSCVRGVAASTGTGRSGRAPGRHGRSASAETRSSRDSRARRGSAA